MNSLRDLTPFLLATNLVVFPAFAEDKDHTTMQPQQHGTTMMHANPSDEDDMSHEMHGSPAGNAVTKEVPHSASEHHADHNMDTMQHDMTEHAQRGRPITKTGASSSENLERLKQLPPSGKSREANYDGSYYMHNTSLEQSLEARCALASRGLMMLDNESWKKCGGKPIGWSKGITSAQSDNEHSQHMNH